MGKQNDPLGILSSLNKLSGFNTTGKTPAKFSPRLQRLIARIELLPFGGSIHRYKNGWYVSGTGIDGGWTNNLNGVEDMIVEFEGKVADGVGSDGKPKDYSFRS
jgi:hypothetical protein